MVAFQIILNSAHMGFQVEDKHKKSKMSCFERDCVVFSQLDNVSSLHFKTAGHLAELSGLGGHC